MNYSLPSDFIRHNYKWVLSSNYTDLHAFLLFYLNELVNVTSWPIIIVKKGIAN